MLFYLVFHKVFYSGVAHLDNLKIQLFWYGFNLLTQSLSSEYIKTRLLYGLIHPFYVILVAPIMRSGCIPLLSFTHNHHFDITHDIGTLMVRHYLWKKTYCKSPRKSLQGRGKNNCIKMNNPYFRETLLDASLIITYLLIYFK